ncbi:MAG: phytanoyl-CoA dioxygenase family protein [Pseudomonadota bacterium]
MQDTDALRAHLAANNGIAGLKRFQPGDVDAIVAQFRADGFVLVENVLDAGQVARLADDCAAVIEEILALDSDRAGNRGAHRYSFGGSSMTRSQLHRSAWQMLLELSSVDQLVSAIFESTEYVLRAASGDFCLAGAHEYQRLHADVRDWVSAEKTPFSAFHDPRGTLSIRDLPCPYLAVNFLPQDVTALNGPTRQIPGTQHSRARIPGLEEEPEWMRLSTVCPAPAGSMMIRDTRAWHGGTPNLSDATRAIPNLEFYAPWFREPMPPQISYRDYQALSPRARQRIAHCVLDSSETLDTRTTLRAP